MALTRYELDILRAAVEAEDQGADPDGATHRVPHPGSGPGRDLVLSRLADRGFLDVAIQRNGSGDIYVALLRRVLPAGLDALRQEPEAPSVLLTHGQLAAVEELSRLIRRAIDQDELQGSDEDKADLEAQLATIEAQRRSPRARRQVWVVLLETTRSIAESALGSGAYAAAGEIIRRILT